MKINIKTIHPDAVIPFKTYDDDFCYDVVAVSCEELAPNVYRYGLGFALEIQETGYTPSIPQILKNGNVDCHIFKPCKISVDLRPRSSVWKTGLVLSNCEGTIDIETYRGEISAVFYHVLPEMPIYKVGDRIGQIKLGLTLPMYFNKVDTLSETARNAGGYGSTGN